MAFNFKPPESSGTSSSGLFGTSNNAGSNTTGGGMFGNTTGAASGGFKFSHTPAGGSEQKPSLFGSTGGPVGFGFSKPADNKMEPPKPLFGSQPPATPGASGPSLFGGNTTPAGGQKFNFGNPSTTPAGQPPAQSNFGASTGGTSLFSPTANTSSAASVPKPSFSFTQPGATTSTSASFSTPATSGPNTTSGTASTGISFGTTQAGTPSFGGTLFGNKPAEKPTEANPKPPTPMVQPSNTLFNSNASSTTTSTNTSAPSLFAPAPATTSNSGSFFQKPAASEPSKPLFLFPSTTTQAASQPTPASSGSAPTKPLFGGLGGTMPSTVPAPLSFGPPAATGAATPASSTATSAPASAPSLFGGFSTTAPSTTTTKTPSTSTAAPKFSFGAPAPTSTSQAATVAPTSTTTTAANVAPTSASTAPPTQSPAFNTNLGASTAGPAPPAQSRLRNKTMDEILTRWATDLTRYSKEFKNHAETIAQWDQIIVDNSQKIDKLYVKTRTCEKQTMSVEMQLAAVENQQNELESWLAKYENDVEEMLAKDGANQSEIGGPDQERERTYKLAEKLGERLDDMGRDLESMVEEVNAANSSLSKHTKSDEPITQIVRILNSHLTQLQVIDQGTAQLQAKVTAAQKTASGMGYLNGSANGDGRAAVDDFYRSYMGRR